MARGRVKTSSESALHVWSKTRYAYFSYFLFAAVPFSTVEILSLFFSFFFFLNERNFCFPDEKRENVPEHPLAARSFLFLRLFLRRIRKRSILLLIGSYISYVCTRGTLAYLFSLPPDVPFLSRTAEFLFFDSIVPV